MTLLERLRRLVRRSDEWPRGGPTAEEKRLDATPAAVAHNNPDTPGGGLPPPGYLPAGDDGRPRH